MAKKPPTYAERAKDSQLAKEMLSLRVAQAKEEGLAPSWACGGPPSVGDVARSAEALASSGRAMGAKMAALARLFALSVKAAPSRGRLADDAAEACLKLAKALEGPEMSGARAMWVACAKASDKAGSDGAGLHAHWIAKALEADDEQELGRLLDAGAQPWALGGCGWHPLDWVWLLDAKACAPRMAQAIMPWEEAAKRPGAAPVSSLTEAFRLSRSMGAFIFDWESMIYPPQAMSHGQRIPPGFGRLSRAWSQGGRWGSFHNGRPGSEQAFRLLAMTGLGAPRASGQRRAMDPQEALSAWERWLPEGEARAWVSSAALRAISAPASPGSSKPRL